MDKLCCFNTSPSYAPIETTIDGASKPGNANGSRQDFPGNRRILSTYTNTQLVKTGGNALMEYDPETMKDLVYVTLPEGCHAGQVIHVQDPNSTSGRVAQIIVPPGSRSGTTIMVKLPEDQYFTPDETGNNNGFLTDLTLKEEVVAPHSETTEANNRFLVQSQDIPMSYLASHQSNQNNYQQKEKQSSMLVKVPVGVAPGTIIHVKIPDEDKFVPVVVPKGGVSQFYANYSLEDTINMKNGGNQQQQSKEQNWHDNPIAYGAPMLVLPGIL